MSQVDALIHVPRLSLFLYVRFLYMVITISVAHTIHTIHSIHSICTHGLCQCNIILEALNSRLKHPTAVRVNDKGSPSKLQSSLQDLRCHGESKHRKAILVRGALDLVQCGEKCRLVAILAADLEAHGASKIASSHHQGIN